MRHSYFGRKLGRNVDERRRLFMVLVRQLITHGRIKTTLAKAKAIQPMVDKLITKAKGGSNADLSELRKTLAAESMVSALRDMAKTRFHPRTSGYTRIIRLGKRYGDAAEEVLLEFVDAAPVKAEVVKVKPNKKGATVQEAEVVAEKKPEKVTKKRAPSKK
jgi:large subunit ribosomal protein L17